MTPADLMERIEKGIAPIVLDVRSRLEFAGGHVPGARHIPFWQVTSHLEALAPLKDQEIVVYCGHGPRAHIAGAVLRRNGFTHVTYLKGHMKRWRELSLPLDRA
jgi:rhodanese-related sulfurtransferase